MSVCTYFTHSANRMSNGQRFNPRAMACASRVYPLHSRLRIVAANGRRVIVTVTDRTARGRSNCDLTPKAFSALCGQGVNYRVQGVLHVHIHRIGANKVNNHPLKPGALPFTRFNPHRPARAGATWTVWLFCRPGGYQSLRACACDETEAA